MTQWMYRFVLAGSLAMAPGCARMQKPDPMKTYEKEVASSAGKTAADRYPELAANAKKHYDQAAEALDDKEKELLDHHAKVLMLWWRAAMARSHADDLATEGKEVASKVADAERNLSDAEKQLELAMAATGGSATRDAINKALAAVKDAERVNARVHAKAKFAEAESKLDAATAALRAGNEAKATSLAVEAETAAASAEAEAAPKFAAAQSDSERTGAQRELFKQLGAIDGATAAIVGGGVMVTIVQSFDSSGVDVRPEQQAIYNRVAEVATAFPGLSIVIEGHTDSKGGATKNLQLSDARAKSVAAYLATRGVEPNRMSALGKGSEEPVANNKTKEGRARNRRIEILFATPGV